MGWANVEKGNTYKDNEYLPQLEFIVWKKSENQEKIRGGGRRNESKEDWMCWKRKPAKKGEYYTHETINWKIKG